MKFGGLELSVEFRNFTTNLYNDRSVLSHRYEKKI